MAALGARCGVLRPLEPAEDDSLAAYAVGGVPTVYYVPNWIEEGQEAELLSMADADMSAWEDMGTRATQEWGAGDRCPCGRGLERVPLPEVYQNLAEALHQLGVFDGALFPMNSVRINAYWPGQGIHPHCDGPVYYPKVAILSLGSACVFDFYPCAGNEKTSLAWDAERNVPGGHVGGAEQVSVLLEPRSLLVFARDAFWHHRHGFKAVAADAVGDTSATSAGWAGASERGTSSSAGGGSR
ncbi:unnamed protein product [Prorocentrum cordatum]|uniref:Fe2OG dioxygenase domain-containing protein n=1 Tax=Prorocentrum cordatum TaxID=2364126 RepID=A0ABN9QI24_9DINO|nr:unnamed protein product [Polarella glacialis]